MEDDDFAAGTAADRRALVVGRSAEAGAAAGRMPRCA